MRFHLLGLVLMASVAAPAIAQRAEPIDRRVERLEQQLRAVQRRVFPNGQLAQPEIPPEVQAVMGGAPGANAIDNLAARVDALESQLRSLTNQIEEANNRSQRNAADIAALRTDLNAEQAARAAAPVTEAASAPPRSQPSTSRTRPPVVEPSEPPAEPAPARVVDDAEAAYNVGYRLWSQRRFAEAQGALGDVATRFPNSRWASWARNLQGRAYLDDSKPATAARILLANYQDNPRGERAPDSLYYLGQALTRLDRRAEACRVYDELASVYPDMRDTIRSRLPEARTAARCGASGRN
ncbi:MAG TPA: tetratricopeptide repeat protein [Allosphingosinicella sp.]|nr:tetratricopeptide repeat protein [Allosphingosinicella sp.]